MYRHQGKSPGYGKSKTWDSRHQNKDWSQGWKHGAPDETEDQLEDPWKKGGRTKEWGPWNKAAPDADYTGMDSEADTWRKKNDQQDARRGGGQCAKPDDDPWKNMRQDPRRSATSTQPHDFEPRGACDIRATEPAPHETAPTPPGLTLGPAPPTGFGKI